MRHLLRFVAKPQVLSALAFGLSGIAFVAANLLLARQLPVEQFALIALLVSIMNVAMVAAPLGLDGVVTRKSVAMGPAILQRVLLLSMAVAAISALYARIAYSIDLLAIGLLFACICGGGIITLVAAYFQAEHAFGRSLFYLRSQDFALFLASVATIALAARLALVPLTVLTAIYLLVSARAWRDALHQAGAMQPSPLARGAINIREAGSYVSVQLSNNLLLQLERLLAASLLSLKDLATLGVILAVVGPPFRLLQLSVGYALQPRLRAAESRSVRIRLLMNELALAAAVVSVASIALWFATPLLVRVLLRGKFSVSGAVMLAVLVSGALKVSSGIAKASMTAIVDSREMTYVAVVSWISVGVAIAAASAGSKWGLSGVIYGVAMGWVVWTAAAAYFVIRRLRDSADPSGP